MSSELTAADELLGFISASARPDLRRTTLHFLLGLSAGSDTSLFKQDDQKLLKKLSTLLRDLQNDNTGLTLVLNIFINLTSYPLICSHLREEPCFISFLTSHFQPESIYAVPVSKIMSNLTVQDDWCDHLMQLLNLHLFCQTTIKALNEKDFNECTVYLGYVLRNLTRIASVRKMLVERENGDNGRCLLSELYPLLKFMSIEQKERNQIAIDIIRNCSFDTDLHKYVMPSEDLIVALLYPLIGHEELKDEDMETLPLELQYMTADKVREPMPQVRRAILETLYQLCASSVCRVHLREHGTYCILREYHKWETDAEADLLVGNVIGVLIRTEAEIGVHDLKQMQTKNDLEAID